MSWTQEREEKLKELWKKGHTASQIAEILGGTTRNAVIGKAHRLKLAARAASKTSRIVKNAPWGGTFLFCFVVWGLIFQCFWGDASNSFWCGSAAPAGPVGEGGILKRKQFPRLKKDSWLVGKSWDCGSCTLRSPCSGGRRIKRAAPMPSTHGQIREKRDT